MAQTWKKFSQFSHNACFGGWWVVSRWVLSAWNNKIEWWYYVWMIWYQIFICLLWINNRRIILCTFTLGHNNRQKWHLPFSENKTTNGSAGAILMRLPGDVPSSDSIVFGDSLFACCVSLVENLDVIELLFLIPNTNQMEWNIL